MNLNIKKMGIVLLLFIYLFVPPFLPIGTGILCSLFFVLYILANLKSIENHLFLKPILGIAFGITTLLLYAVFVYVRVYNSFENIVPAYMGYVYMISFTLCGTMVICDICAKNGYSAKEIWELIIYAGAVQGILGFGAYLIDPIQTVLCKFLENIMAADEIAWWRNFRLYGLASSLNFSMPVLQSIIGAMALIYAKQYNKKYLIFVPILWGSALINARITLVVVLIVLFVMVMHYLGFQHNLKIKNTVLFFITMGVAGAVFAVCWLVINKVNLSRITDPIVEVLALLRGETVFKTNGYLAYFLADSVAFVMPENESLIWGGGIWNQVSDIGYIYDLWVGGIVYSLMMYLFYLVLFKKWYNGLKNQSAFERTLPIICCITLFVVNVKGNIFGGMSEFINLCYLLIGVSLFIKKNKNKSMRKVNPSE